MELVGRKWRTMAGVLINFFWCTGMFVLVGLAYGIRDWKHLQLATSCYTVLYLLLWWLIPESPRWLISKGRIDEARVILERVATSNMRVLPKNAFDADQTESKEQRGSIKDIFLHRVLAFRAFVVFVNWLFVTMVYYGLTLNVGSLNGNIYMNFAVNSSVETLGNIMTMIALPRFGRKWFYCGSMLLSGIACLCCMIPPLTGNSSPEWILIVLSNVGKFGATGGFATIYVFTAELFPTSLRNSIIGSSSMIARIGGMISPYIADLSILVEGKFGTALPYIVFGASALVVGTLALALPETLNMTLPETIQDAINFGKKKPTSDEATGQPQDNDKIVRKSPTYGSQENINRDNDKQQINNPHNEGKTNSAFVMEDL